MENLEDDMTIFTITPSRPMILGRTSVKGASVMHITITPPTPVRLPSSHTHHR